MKSFILTLLILISASTSCASSFNLNKEAILSISDVNVRPGSGLGYDLIVSPWLPFIKSTQVVKNSNDLGIHYFGGINFPLTRLVLNYLFGIVTENINIFYSCRGGFIDLGHLRHHADLVALFAVHAEEKSKKGGLLELDDEAGQRIITFHPQKEPLSKETLLRISEKLSYDLSVWHEVVTWYGYKIFPLISERSSSFSPEDLYSNLLGAKLGVAALKNTQENYNMAITHEITQMVKNLGGFSKKVTYQQLDLVKDRWWFHDFGDTGHRHRHFDAYPTVKPWIIQDNFFELCGNASIIPLQVIEHDERGKKLDSYYKLEISPADYIPFEDIFPDRDKRIITSSDLPKLLEYTKNDILNFYNDFTLDRP